MTEPQDTSFLAEVKRRKVGRVAVAYVGVMMGVLEVAQYALELFGISGPLYRALLFAAVAGFPVVLALAWLFDLTSKGIERTPNSATDAGPGGLPARFARQVVVTGAVVVLAMTGIGWRYMPTDGAELDPNQITVIRFDNQTSDPGLDALGLIVADHVIEGLGHMEAFRTLALDPSLGVSAAPNTSSAGQPDITRERAVAESTGSSLVVTGSYFRAGDDLTFRAVVHDAERGEVAFSAEPVSVNQDDPMADFDRLRDGLFGYFGLLGSRDAESADAPRQLAGRRAPTFAAYKEYAQGVRLFSGGGGSRAAAEQYALASSIDPTFFGALWRESTMRINTQEWAEVERLVDGMESMQADLTDAERVGVEWTRGQIDGDLRKVHDAAVEAVARVPVSAFYYLAGVACSAVNRPAEAIELFSGYDLKRKGNWPFIWTTFADARHRLGQHRRELWLIREGREAFPDRPPARAAEQIAAEFTALAALGRGEEVVERIGELNPYFLILGVAEELEMHGDSEAAQQLFARVLDQLDELPPEEQRMYNRPLLRAQALAALDRDDEAFALIETLLEVAPDNSGYRSLSAILAARGGDRESAEEVIAWFGALDVPYQRGINVYEQARIAGALGDAERAVRFLETAFDQGTARFSSLHVDPAFRDIGDHPAFAAFMQPKG